MRGIDQGAAVELVRGAGAMLEKLPDDCVWFQGTWSELDPAALRHVYSEDWAAASASTGSLERTARLLLEGGASSPVLERVTAIAAQFDRSRCDPLLLGANNVEQGPFVIIDGNHRATAILLRAAMGDPVPVGDLPIVVAMTKSQPIWSWDE
ncbi:MAG: hypothetical protein ACYTGZ_12285 [Planctomycetota bacterium]|jgi:hypothetical protein